MKQKIGFGTALIGDGIQRMQTSDQWPDAAWALEEDTPTLGEALTWAALATAFAGVCVLFLVAA